MRRLVTAVAVSSLVACGGGGESGDGSSGRPTVAGIAAKLRAGGIVCDATSAPADERELLARDQGDCESENLRIVIYNTNSSRDQAMKIGQEFGGIGVIGDRWIVEVPNDAWEEKVQEVLGGRVT